MIGQPTLRARLLLVIVGTSLAGCSGSSPRADEAMCQPENGAYPVLVAQSVPSATLLPCIQALAPGWSYGGSEVRDGLSRFWLNSDRAGFHAVEVSLTQGCSVEGLVNVTAASGELGVQVFFEPLTFSPFTADRYFVFAGGCVTYRYRFGDADQAPTLAFEVDKALTFVSRSLLVDLVEDELGMSLCGAGAPPCVGED